MASLITSVSAWGKLDESHLYNQRSNWRSFPSLVFPFKSAGGGTGASKGMECLVFRFRFAFIYSDLLSLIIGRFEPNFIPSTNRAKCPLPSLFHDFQAQFRVPFDPQYGKSFSQTGRLGLPQHYCQATSRPVVLLFLLNSARPLAYASSKTGISSKA